ncbi:MAG: hypothetical protein RNU03_01420 [Candidatus Sedimenticola sp. (ex Thyasira tokunagai)]
MEDKNKSRKNKLHILTILLLVGLLVLGKVLWAVSIWYEVIPLGLAGLLIWRMKKSEKRGSGEAGKRRSNKLIMCKHSNQWIKFAPCGRWNLRFAAAPHPDRYAVK